jgi:uncharacterized protein
MLVLRFNIMYKTLGFKWLLEVFCPASAFVSADRDEARNPQRFIHVTVDKEFLTEINSVAQKTYSRIATIHHYLSMAKKAFEEVTNAEEYKLKKFFYALRASVACLWILEKEEIPPIEFGKMLNGLDLPANLITRIGELIEIKSTISETYRHKGETVLIEFMKACIERAENESQSLPASKGRMTDLNDFFLKTLA